jgi:hypothetical protein
MGALTIRPSNKASAAGMFMLGGWYRRATGAPHSDLPRWIGVIVAAPIAFTASACTTDGLTTGSLSPGTSVAFERIDGAPEHVFRKLVQDLSEEAEARQISVVSRDGAARYRIRGYVAAHTHNGRTTVAWVWDIYDADQSRALRISGEEDAGGPAKNAWETDDELLHRLSRIGMDRIAAFLSAPSTQASLPVRASDRMFASDGISPESTSILRSMGGDSTEERHILAMDAQSTERPPALRSGSTRADTVASISD